MKTNFLFRSLFMSRPSSWPKAKFFRRGISRDGVTIKIFGFNFCSFKTNHNGMSVPPIHLNVRGGSGCSPVICSYHRQALFLRLSNQDSPKVCVASGAKGYRPIWNALQSSRGIFRNHDGDSRYQPEIVGTSNYNCLWMGFRDSLRENPHRYACFLELRQHRFRS